jgi:hypothetical protein
MNEQEQKRLADLLKHSVLPMNSELNRDLWPKMLRRFEQRSGNRQWLSALFSASALSSVPWFDWALLAVLIAGICIFPKSIPIWLYHF